MASEDSADALFDRSLFRPQEMEVDSTQQLYGDGTERMIVDLHMYLPAYQKQLGTRTYTLVRDNLRVLTSCFYSNSLNAEAVEIIHQHLLTLSRMLTLKSN